MALIPVRDDIVAPVLFKQFTDPSADVTLHISSDHGGGAPAGINHLPCQLFVQAEAGEILAFADVLGNEVSHTFTAPFYGTIRVAPAQLLLETDCSVTVFWHTEP